MNLRRGMKVTCFIGIHKVDDAEIQQENNGEFFICQNVIQGSGTRDKRGYKCSWVVGRGNSRDLKSHNVRNLKEVKQEVCT